MRPRFCLGIILLAFVLSLCQSSGAATNVVSTDLAALIAGINDKLRNGKNTEKDLADDIKQFDTLYAKYKDAKTDQVADILMMKAQLFSQVLDQPNKALDVMQQIVNELPDTEAGRNAAKMIEPLQAQVAAQKIRDALTPGVVFPNFEEQDLEGKTISVTNYSGRLVLVDFWATWCLPCLTEMPHLLAAYEKHQTSGLEIVGISLDTDKDMLSAYVKKRNIPWRQICDGKGFEGALPAKYGIVKIPSNYLLDREGKIIAVDLRGENLEKAVAKALEAK